MSPGPTVAAKAAPDQGRWSSQPAILGFTGQPFIDVGACAIAAFSGRQRLEDATVDDLTAIADFIERNYSRDPFKSFLSSIFPNSGYVNPTMGEDKRKAFNVTYVRAYTRTDTKSIAGCAFCGRPANTIAFRQHIPLVAGEGVVNYGAGGHPGTPVCGVCLLCIQALPIGCDRCEGRLLLAHADDPQITFTLTKQCVEANLSAVSLGAAGGSGSGLERKYPRTLIIQRLLAALRLKAEAADEGRNVSLIAYHLTNYGTGADVRMHVLPARALTFVEATQRANYRQAWQRIVKRSWVVSQPRVSKGKAKAVPLAPIDIVDPEPGTYRNTLYEQIFDLPAEAPRFIRRFLMHRSPEVTANGITIDLDLLSWSLTQLFLEAVIDMDKERIARIRALGDRLATLVTENNDRQLLTDLYRLRSYGQIRGVLIKAELAALRRGDTSVITFDDFITIFEESEEFPRIDWPLARDLVLIRMLEQLRERHWIQTNMPVVAAMEDADRASEVNQPVANGISGEE